MVTTLGVAEEIDDYGSTHGEDLVVPLTMLERNHHPTSSKHPSIFLSWKTKKVMLGIIGLTAAVVVTSATLFFSGPQAARTGPSSVLLQHYPYVAITNKTPYAVRDTARSSVQYLWCDEDLIAGGLAAGQTWTASSRGLCLVNRIYVTLTFPNPARPPWTADNDFFQNPLYNNGYGPSWGQCAPYDSSGTSFSIYSIIMKGDDECCVLSSNEIQKCP